MYLKFVASHLIPNQSGAVLCFKKGKLYLEQEFFSGLKYRPTKKESKTVLVVIYGKLVITGCKKEGEIPELAYYMKRMLLKFKR